MRTDWKSDWDEWGGYDLTPSDIESLIGPQQSLFALAGCYGPDDDFEIKYEDGKIVWCRKPESKKNS